MVDDYGRSCVVLGAPWWRPRAQPGQMLAECSVCGRLMGLLTLIYLGRVPRTGMVMSGAVGPSFIPQRRWEDALLSVLLVVHY